MNSREQMFLSVPRIAQRVEVLENNYPVVRYRFAFISLRGK